MNEPPLLLLFRLAIKRLVRAGHQVEAQDIPGLFRVDGGPELTVRQVINLAQSHGLLTDLWGEWRNIENIAPFEGEGA
jgi:hypothetical protein